MLDKISGLHLELTNMCTLKCPRCPRTNFIERFPSNWTNINLNFEHLKNFLDIDLSGKLIDLGGNYGDPIYYDKLFEVIEYFKVQGCYINISTNGSYRSSSWWNELSILLDSKDTVIFGIDGIPDNFTKYRVNADWKSIKLGIEVLSRSPVRTVWKYIPFSFNEENINQAQTLSKSLGITEFQISPSNRWIDDHDWLKPETIFCKDDTANILSWKSENIRNVDIEPKCLIDNNQHFISASGFYMPCCYTGNHQFYYKTDFYKNKEYYDITKTTISNILSAEKLCKFYSTLMEEKHDYCTFNCQRISV